MSWKMFLGLRHLTCSQKGEASAEGFTYLEGVIGSNVNSLDLEALMSEMEGYMADAAAAIEYLRSTWNI